MNIFLIPTRLRPVVAFLIFCSAWFSILALILSAVTATGWGAPKKKPKKEKVRRVPMPLEIVRPRGRMTKRIVLIVDVSGSMTDARIEEALDAVWLVTTQPVDALEVACFAFSDTYQRWPGVPEPCKHKGKKHTKRCLPWGWARFPSVGARKKLMSWVKGSKLRGGGTEPGIVLRACMHIPGKFSVILISDGEFSQDPRVALREGFGIRKRAKLPKVMVSAYGVGKQARKLDLMINLAKAGLGGYWIRGKRSGPW